MFSYPRHAKNQVCYVMAKSIVVSGFSRTTLISGDGGDGRPREEQMDRKTTE
jgi:hypothetical protein